MIRSILQSPCDRVGNMVSRQPGRPQAIHRCDLTTVPCHTDTQVAPARSIIAPNPQPNSVHRKETAMATTMRHLGRLLSSSLLVVLLLAGCGGPPAVTATLTDTAIQVSSNTL